MQALPTGASEASWVRYELAQQLVATCPGGLGREVALTGSAARGVADDFSDLELDLWVDALPPAADRAAWLRAIGASDVALDVEATPDGTAWSTFRFQGVWVEAGWQCVAQLEANLDDIVSGRVIEHRQLMVAAMLHDAVFLRTSGRGIAWQRTLARYPDGLAARLIDATVQEWIWPQWLQERWALIRRGDGLPLTRALVSDVLGVLRILFALNHQWEPDWKWLAAACSQLQLQPDRLLERIDTIVANPALELRLTTTLQLTLDTLALVPPDQDVSRATATIRDSLMRSVTLQ